MDYIKVLLPSVVVGLIFWYAMRSILKSDKIEREEMDKYYSQIHESATSAESVSDSDDESGADSPEAEDSNPVNGDTLKNSE